MKIRRALMRCRVKRLKSYCKAENVRGTVGFQRKMKIFRNSIYSRITGPFPKFDLKMEVMNMNNLKGEIVF